MPKGYTVQSITYGGTELTQGNFSTTGKDFSFLRITVSATAPPTPGSTTLVVTQSNRSPRFPEGAFTYFEVRSTDSGAIRLKARLGGQNCYQQCGPSPPPAFDSTAFTLPAGMYQVSSYVRACDGNCGHLGPSTMECRASFLIASGETLYATRLQSSGGCEIDASPTRPGGVR
jgi:hypothetical protein